MLRRINQVLPGLLAGIVGYGVLIQLVGMWFVEDRFHYTTGLWIGIGCALGMAIHIAVSIEDAVSIYSEDGAKRKVIQSALIRYIVVVAIFVAMMYFKLGMLVPAFLGVLGLKFSAYLQPVIQKRIENKKKEKDSSSQIDECAKTE